MRLFVLSIAVWAATVLQSSLASSLPPMARPNLPLLVALCGAWRSGAPGGAWLGFWSGWLMASVSGMFVGSLTFSHLVAGWGVGRIGEEVYGDRSALVVPVVGLGTLLGELIFFLWNPRHVGSPLTMIWSACLDALLAPLLYFPMETALRRFKER